MSRRLLLGLASGAALALSACGPDVVEPPPTTDTLSAEQVATAAEDALEQEVGTRPDITCPEELAKERGATTRCTSPAVTTPWSTA